MSTHWVQPWTRIYIIFSHLFLVSLVTCINESYLVFQVHQGIRKRLLVLIFLEIKNISSPEN